MILKLLTRKTGSYGQLLNYILKGHEEHPFIIKHHIRGKSVKEYVQQYRTNEFIRLTKRSNSNYIFHEIISFSRDLQNDLTPEIMEDLTHKYIQLRNPNMMAVAVQHTDKQPHVHLCISATDKTGKSLSIKKGPLLKLKKDMLAYQKERYPHIPWPILEHGKSQKKRHVSDKEYRMKQRTGRLTDRDVVLKILNDCYKSAISKADFFSKLKSYGLETYVRGGKLTGVIHGKRKHRLDRLGFIEDKLLVLDSSMNRNNELRVARQKREQKEITRSI
jgi:hypothetical protein